MTAMKRLTIHLLWAMLLLPWLSTASASNMDWYEQPYPYLVVNQDVRDVLTQFGDHLGVRVVLSENVQGNIDKKLFEKTAGEFLTALSEAADLAWYVSENSIHFESDENVMRESISTSGYADTDIRKAIGSFQTPGRGVSLLYDGSAQRIVVTGPEPYLGLVRQAIGRLPVQAAKTERTTTRIFRGTDVQVQSY